MGHHTSGHDANARRADELGERLSRLEEAQTFDAHRADKLHEQLVALTKAISEFGVRLSRFEKRLEDSARAARQEIPRANDHTPSDE